MKISDALLDVLETVEHRGMEEIEVFHKKGRSRTVRRTLSGETSSLRQEEGWAVRAGDRRRSFFYAAAGLPSPDTDWPEGDGEGLRLPPTQTIPSWTAPADLDASLLGENEASMLFEGLRRELEREAPGARLLHGYLEDGSSEQQLINSRRASSLVRQRTASLYVEATSRRGGASFSLLLAEREARRFRPQAVARRLADRLLIAEKGSAPIRDRGDFLLSHGVVIPLLAALGDLWSGSAPAAKALDALRDRQGRMASRKLSIVDNGRLPGGIMEAPVDGEGQATRRIALVEDGIFRQPLVSWHSPRAGAKPSGCCRRSSWKDLPTLGPTHLYIEPEINNSVASLLGSVSRGYYLLGIDGRVRVEPGYRRFAVPVSGFAIDGGRPTGSVSGVWLIGTVSSLLHGITAVGRDLTFTPVANALLGAPTVLARGLELRRQP